MDTALDSPTQALADWVVRSTWSQVDAGAKSAAGRSFLNWLGCALGGANDGAVDRLVEAILPPGQGGPSPLLGRRETTDAGTAALVMAFASNILDYDDTHWATAIHPAGTVASALVAWAGQGRVTGEEFLHAFLLGMEVECRIGLAVSPAHYGHGWHITATCGVFGAAVAVGKVMGLSPQQMAWALGHAGTQSAGLVASLGTAAKSLNIGHAARNGLVAAQLARHGMTANERILEARFGFADVMGVQPLATTLCERLGRHWECERNTFKPYPCGFLLHPAFDACLAAARDPALEPSAVEQVVLAVHPLAQVRADRPHPADGLASKLSLQHAAAMALLRGDPGVRAFTDASVHDAGVRALRAKVSLDSDASLPADAARVTVTLRTGTAISREVQPGSAAAPAMDDAALERKFRDLVTHGAAHCDADRLLEGLRFLAQAPDAADLFRLTLPSPDPRPIT